MTNAGNGWRGGLDWTGRLPLIPLAGRVTLTAFLAIVGVGYLVAVANIYHSHDMADGKAGMTLDDLRAVYSGITVTREEETEVPSRMLTMIRTSMRQYIDSDEDFEILEGWLVTGGNQAALTEGPKGKTPRRVILRNCVRCHAASTGTDISKESPFGPDEFTVEYEKLASFLATQTETEETTAHSPPQYTIPRLVLVSHIHMLAIPLFTLVVAGLFMCSRFPAMLRGIVLPLPMIALVLDFSGWWLARLWPGFIGFIVVGGAVFGVAFGVQVLVVTIDLWRPGRGG